MAEEKKVRTEKATERELQQFYGKPIDISEEEKVRMVDHFAAEIQKSLDERKSRDMRHKELIDLCEGITPQRTKPWKDAADMTLGVAPSITNTVYQNVTMAITQVVPMINAHGMDDGVTEEDEALVEKWINAYFTPDIGPIDGFMFADQVISRAARDGTCNVVTSFEREERVVWQIDKNGVPEKRVEIHKKVCPIVLELEQAITPTNATEDPKELEWFAYQTNYTPDKLKDFALKRGYKNIQDLFKDMVGSTSSAGAQPVSMAKKDANYVVPGLAETENMVNDRRLASQGKVQEKKAAYNVMVAFGLWRFEENEQRQWVMLIYNHTNKAFMECRWMPIFYDGVPVDSYKLDPFQGKWDGHSILQKVAGISYEIDGLNCRMLDNIDIALNKVITYVPGGAFDPDQHKIFPGAAFPSETKGEVDVLDIGDINFSAFPMVSRLLTFAHSQVGVSSGATSGQTDTADPRASGKKTQTLIGESNKKMDFMVRHINNAFCGTIRKIVHYHAVADFAEIEFKRWNAEKRKIVTDKISRALLQKKFRFTINAMSLSVNRAEELQGEMFMQEVMKNHPLFTMAVKTTQAGPGLDQYAPSQIKAMYYNLLALLQKANVQNIEARMPVLKELLPPEKIEPSLVPPPQPPEGFVIPPGQPGLETDPNVIEQTPQPDTPPPLQPVGAA